MGMCPSGPVCDNPRPPAGWSAPTPAEVDNYIFVTELAELQSRMATAPTQPQTRVKCPGCGSWETMVLHNTVVCAYCRAPSTTTEFVDDGSPVTLDYQAIQEIHKMYGRGML